jgi:hypothetical protein
MTLVRAHTAPNARCTGNVSSDAARQDTLRPDEERHGICLPDEECQGIFLPDAAVSSRRSRVIWTQPWLLVAARGFLPHYTLAA